MSPEDMQANVDLILREIERSDNEALRSKKDVMEAFIKTRFYELPEEADIQDAYEQFERETLQAEMEEFSYEKGIDYLIINDIFTDFVFTQTVSEEAIRKRLEAYHFGLLKMNAMTNEIKGFVTDTYKKYKAEGE